MQAGHRMPGNLPVLNLYMAKSLEELNSKSININEAAIKTATPARWVAQIFYTLVFLKLYLVLWTPQDSMNFTGEKYSFAIFGKVKKSILKKGKFTIGSSACKHTV